MIVIRQALSGDGTSLRPVVVAMGGDGAGNQSRGARVSRGTHIKLSPPGGTLGSYGGNARSVLQKGFPQSSSFSFVIAGKRKRPEHAKRPPKTVLQALWNGLSVSGTPFDSTRFAPMAESELTSPPTVRGGGMGAIGRMRDMPIKASSSLELRVASSKAPAVAVPHPRVFQSGAPASKDTRYQRQPEVGASVLAQHELRAKHTSVKYHYSNTGGVETRRYTFSRKGRDEAVGLGVKARWSSGCVAVCVVLCGCCGCVPVCGCAVVRLLSHTHARCVAWATQVRAGDAVGQEDGASCVRLEGQGVYAAVQSCDAAHAVDAPPTRWQGHHGRRCDRSGSRWAACGWLADSEWPAAKATAEGDMAVRSVSGRSPLCLAVCADAHSPNDRGWLIVCMQVTKNTEGALL